MSACKVVGCGKSGRLCPGCVAACMSAEYGQQATHEARCGTFYEGLCQRMAASAYRAGRVSPTPAAEAPERRDRAIERLESRLNLHSKRINCTQNWLSAAIGGVVILSVLAYFS